MENPAHIAIFAKALSPSSPLLPSHALTVTIFFDKKTILNLLFVITLS